MPYLFIKVAVDHGVPPVFLAWVRIVLGSAVGLLLILAGSWLSTDGRLPPGLAERLSSRRRDESPHTPTQSVTNCAG